MSNLATLLEEVTLQLETKTTPPSDPFFERKKSLEIDSFQQKDNYLKTYCEEVEPFDFYRFIFPEGSFERLGHQEDERPNGLVLSLYTDKENKNRGKHTIVTDGLEQLPELLRQDYVVMSPISYYGRSRKADNASYLYALTLDVDYVGLPQLQNLLYQMENGIIPAATFIVNSGHGVHLYYVLEQPVLMYRSAQTELKKLKKALITRVWSKYTSTNTEAREALGVVQGFRMVGSRSKIGNEWIVKAYEVGAGERVTIDYLNSFVYEEERAIDFKYKSRVTLSEAKKKYPEWYERRIINNEPPGRWYVKRDLYDWFKRKIEYGGTIGHRYFCIMSLAIYANKCGISEEELYQDAMHYQEVFNDLDQTNTKPFTIEETLKALECFNDSYARFPRETIERITAIAMPANRRNGRTQEMHLKRIRRIKAGMIEDGETFKNPEGRPKGSGTKQQQVAEWRKANPEGRKVDCIRETGISKPTVLKWWDTKTAD